MIKQILKNKFKFLLVGFILLLALFLRIYKLPEIYIFNFDEEYQATIVWTLIKDFHPLWVGVSASLMDFYLGPYFTYFTYFLMLISKGGVLLPAYFAAVTGVITVGLIFFIGWKLFNYLTGVIASLLYASLPLFVYYDQKYWNATFDQIIILGMFLSFYLMKKSKWWFVLFVGLVGVMFETHLSPIPLLGVGLYFFIRYKIWKSYKILVCSFFVFIFFYWPLIVFDYNHNWSNLTLPLRLAKATSSNEAKYDPVNKLQVLGDSLGRFWYLKPGNPNADEINFGCSSLSFPNGAIIDIDKYTHRTYGLIGFSIFSGSLLLLFVYYLFKYREYNAKLLFSCLVIQLLFFLAFSGGSSEYYILGFLTLFTFIPGILISKLKFRKLILPFFLIFIILGAFTVMNNSSEFSLDPKRILISNTMEVVKDEPFELRATGFCHEYEGWRYLYKAYGKLPVRSYSDKNLSWLYPDEVSSKPVNYIVTMSETRIPLNEPINYTYKFAAGGYTAYIQKINDQNSNPK